VGPESQTSNYFAGHVGLHVRSVPRVLKPDASTMVTSSPMAHLSQRLGALTSSVLCVVNRCWVVTFSSSTLSLMWA